MMEPTSREYRLLGILQEHAPTGGAQQDCSRMVHEAIQDGADASDLEILLAGALIDGLRHNNWPWLIRTFRWIPVSEEDLQLHPEYSFECKFCGAPIRKRCITKTGEHHSTPHFSRQTDYRERQPE